jgi:cAMP-specific phosphodiesterase 4
MHTCYLLSNSSKVRHILSPFKIFCLVFSGLCHDVGHTGFTNLFEIASHSKKATTYNDNSVLS